VQSYRPPHETEEYRRKWAREVFARLGFGLARDDSGFYRPAVRTLPGSSVDPVPRRRRRGRMLEFSGQLKLNFDEETTG